jgi:hypothetical protein
MKKYRDCMLDLETMSNTYNAPIIQIAVAKFNRDDGDTSTVFYENLSLEEEMQQGFTTDANTILWWLSQSKEAQESILKEPCFDIHTIYGLLNNVLRDYENIWSHSTFDAVILNWHYKKLGITPKFHYSAFKDIRTLTELAGINSKDYPRQGTNHNALDDCKHQIEYCVDAFNVLRKE